MSDSQARPHETFVEFLDCIETQAGKAKWQAFLRGPEGHLGWMAGGARYKFAEFRSSDGIEALRNVWGRLPELRKAGKGEVQSVLAEHWKEKFPEDNSAIIAEGIWCCALLHGDREAPGLPDSPNEDITANAPAPPVPSDQARKDDAIAELDAGTSPAPSEPQNPEKPEKSEAAVEKPASAKSTERPRIAANIDKLRKDCGWSLDQLAEKTDLGKKLVVAHVNGRTKPRPSTVRVYTDVFSKALGRAVTPSSLEE